MKTTIGITKAYELIPVFDSRKSFYGKATVYDRGGGVYELKSYQTIVSRCVNGVVTHLGRYSRTTSRHQREFERQFSK